MTLLKAAAGIIIATPLAYGVLRIGCAVRRRWSKQRMMMKGDVKAPTLPVELFMGKVKDELVDLDGDDDSEEQELFAAASGSGFKLVRLDDEQATLHSDPDVRPKIASQPIYSNVGPGEEEE
jgi:hypothetical protein